MNSRVLVVSAHPDDEVIGAGGTLLRHASTGDELFWCIVTQGYVPQWTEEQLKTARQQVENVQGLLGIAETFKLGLPTVRLNTIPQAELTDALQQVIDKVQPAVVYVPSSDDINQDHRIVHDAALVACRPLPGRAIGRVLSYEIPTTSRYGWGPFQANVFVDVTKYLDGKLQLMSCYASELRPYPHPRSVEGIRLLAQERGLSIGVGAAECFQLVRELQ